MISGNTIVYNDSRSVGELSNFGEGYGGIFINRPVGGQFTIQNNNILGNKAKKAAGAYVAIDGSGTNVVTISGNVIASNISTETSTYSGGTLFARIDTKGSGSSNSIELYCLQDYIDMVDSKGRC